jgi:hypothetical protein
MAVLHSSNPDSSSQRTHHVRTTSNFFSPKWQQNQFPKLGVLVKGEIYPTTYHEGTEREQKYSSTLSFASPVGGVGS